MRAWAWAALAVVVIAVVLGGAAGPWIMEHMARTVTATVSVVTTSIVQKIVVVNNTMTATVTATAFVTTTVTNNVTVVVNNTITETAVVNRTIVVNRTVVLNRTMVYAPKQYITCNATLYYDPTRGIVAPLMWITMPREMWLGFISNKTELVSGLPIVFAWPYKSPKGTWVWRMDILAPVMILNGELLNRSKRLGFAWFAVVNTTDMWSGIAAGPVYNVTSPPPPEGKFLLFWTVEAERNLIYLSRLAVTPFVAHNYTVFAPAPCTYRLELTDYGGDPHYAPVIRDFMYDDALPPQFVNATGYKVIRDLPGSEQ